MDFVPLQKGLLFLFRVAQWEEISSITC